ncbi:hypothetical protein ACIQTW_12185 [Paenarthrobacter sp. NPDC090517]|uniref:hypothetical protein n=1 Tax=Paenarthrobacter sp. NPDC090517 TaxID=3364381 RepID=UPI0038016BB0
MIRLNREDLSVDNVHPLFGLKKLYLVQVLDSSDEPKTRTLMQDLEVMLHSVHPAMKGLKDNHALPENQERNP